MTAKDIILAAQRAATRQLRTFRARRPVLWRLSLAAAAAAFLAVLCAGALLAAILLGRFGPLPSEAGLAAIRNHTASQVFTADSVLIGTYYTENRTNIRREQLPGHLLDALVATEDARFRSHSGVDRRSILRVFFRTVLLGDERSGGGSTITQQLAKNLYPRTHHGWLTMPVNKFREAVIAGRLERVYDKDGIIVLYLNTVPFGEDVFGIGLAALRYFNTVPDSLRPEESAVLVGMLKAPAAYHPVASPGRAKERRNTVFGQMEKYGYLSPAAADSLSALPLTVRYNYFSHSEGLAPYFREHLRLFMQDWCRDRQKADGSPLDLYTDGLRIYTTLDSRLQRHAEEATAEHLARLQKQFDAHWKGRRPWEKGRAGARTVKAAMVRSDRYRSMQEAGADEEEIAARFADTVTADFFRWEGDTTLRTTPLDSLKRYLSFLQAGFLAADPQTGAIRAWVGGIRHRYFQYDHVTSRRQAGSTFKPAVYAAALQNGIRPCDFFPNRMKTYRAFGDWTPENADGRYGGRYSVHGALAASVNTVTVQVAMKTGLDRIVSLARDLGIAGPLPETPALALGTADVSLLEMTAMYAAFANGGMAVQPRFLSAVTAEDGSLLQDFGPAASARRVLPEATARIITSMLEGAVNSGTASRLRTRYGCRHAAAGKTGTTQSHADGWFIGYTPHLVAGVWVGADDPSVHFRSLRYGSGAHMALPVWAGFFRRVAEDRSRKELVAGTFPPPPARTLDCPPFRKGIFGSYGKEDAGGNKDRQRQEGGKKNGGDSFFSRLQRWFSR